MLIFYNTVLNFLIIQFYDMQLHNMNDMYDCFSRTGKTQL